MPKGVHKDEEAGETRTRLFAIEKEHHRQDQQQKRHLACRIHENEGNEDDEEGKCTYGFLNLYKHKK